MGIEDFPGRRMAESVKRKLGYDDLALMPDDGLIREILDGELFVTPSPSPMHQRVAMRLARQLDQYLAARNIGELFSAPLDTILGPHDVAEPDLLLVTDPAIITKRAIEGAPALVVEILSPSTASRDRTIKARRYAAAGILHYWIVDIDRRRVECLKLTGGEYTPAVVAEGEGTLTHVDWPDLTLDLAALWR
jgi:Uma2 family endonuclease